MKALNHAVGGTVFTGIFASFWNINIFSTFTFLLLSVVASLLPDIDHTRSIIGKTFYPFARWIDKNYGHRTITHSIFFLLVVCLFSAFIEHLFLDSYIHTTILFFGIFSHFIFDMVTIQGIPLFYPFYRNPCVIFGNPAYRIKTNNRNSELVILAIFLLIGLSCINLFQNGFWTSYNRSFGTLKHLHQENKNSNKLISADYLYTKNGKQYSGIGLVVASAENKAYILDDTTYFVLDRSNELVHINHVKPIKTDKDKIIKEFGFFSVNYDSLQSIVRNRVITGNIQSSFPVEYYEDNIRKTSNILKFDNTYNPQIFFLADTSKINSRKQLALKLERLKQNEAQFQLKIDELEHLGVKIVNLKKKVLLEPDSYEKNKLQDQIITLQRDYNREEQNLKVYVPDAVLLKEIEFLRQEVETEENVLFSGLVRYLVF